jgi:hypothetical protein
VTVPFHDSHPLATRRPWTGRALRISGPPERRRARGHVTRAALEQLALCRKVRIDRRQRHPRLGGDIGVARAVRTLSSREAPRWRPRSAPCAPPAGGAGIRSRSFERHRACRAAFCQGFGIYFILSKLKLKCKRRFRRAGFTGRKAGGGTLR